MGRGDSHPRWSTIDSESHVALTRSSGQSGSCPEMISAAEIACFAYCPEQCRLQYGLELLPANRAAL